MTDQEFLISLAQGLPPAEKTRLLSIAERLVATSEFDRGYKTAMDRYYARSNLVKAAQTISPESGAKLVAAIAAHPVTRVAPTSRLAQLGIELDLSDL